MKYRASSSLGVAPVGVEPTGSPGLLHRDAATIAASPGGINRESPAAGVPEHGAHWSAQWQREEAAKAARYWSKR